MIILAIETSCDETAASVIEARNKKIQILSDAVFSQIKIHQKYGGVMPEIAAREHVLKILPVVNEALKKAKITRSRIKEKIDLIAATKGPGLITSLLVGVETAKTLAYAWDIPLAGVNHIEGHIYANFIKGKNIKFPALILTVSGGHTSLILMKNHGQYSIIGETLDDAAGEAFDKAAKMMGLKYPGGPIISSKAEEYKNSLLSVIPAKAGNQSLSALALDSRFRENDRKENENDRKKENQKPILLSDKKSKIFLPRPMLNSPNFNFSFSGLKTALLYSLKKDKNWQSKINEYCHEFEEAVTDVLTTKTIKAAQKFKPKTIMLTGGVSANQNLREKLKKEILKKLPGADYHAPNIKYSADNAVMIGVAGYYNFKNKKNIASWKKLKADCNLEI